MKPLLVEILESILSTDEKLAYSISCDGDEIQSLTRDTSLACNQKEGDEYVGMSNLDEGRIEIYIENEYIGFIYWTNFNDGVERVVDYSLVFDPMYKLSTTLDKWEKDYQFL
tara:strand:- start:1304 stop:1639 length:336 start_codon:yes stop_codon:yes gene_type:complete